MIVRDDVGGLKGVGAFPDSMTRSAHETIFMDTHDPATSDLIAIRWHDALLRGEVPTAEELARDCPELVDERDREFRIREFIRHQTSPRYSSDSTSGPAGRLGTSRPAPIDFDVDDEPVPDYRLVARIGEGGSSEVWRAIGPGGFPLALKFIRLGREGEDGATEARPAGSGGEGLHAHLQSLEVMKGIRHANLLSLFGAWQRNGLLIVGMELADGTLMDRHHEAICEGLPGIPLAELIEYMQQAARGIDYLNEPRHATLGREGVGIQHGDIKPQNLLLVGGVVKVGDFGLAQVLEGSPTSSGSMTPAYAAPEYFRGESSSRSDQYSLAVAYCLLRGERLPFAGNSWEIMMGHYQNAPDLSMLPADERTTVARALSKSPEDRWPDCRTFVEELLECGGAPDRHRGRASERRSRDPIRTPRPRPVHSRRRSVWIGAVGMLLLMLIPLAALISRISRDGGQAPRHPVEKAVDAGVGSATRPGPLEGAEGGRAGASMTDASTTPERGEEARAEVGSPEATPGVVDVDVATVSLFREASRLEEPPNEGRIAQPIAELRMMEEAHANATRAAVERRRIEEEELKNIQEQRQAIAESKKVEEVELKRVREERQAAEALARRSEREETEVGVKRTTRTATVHVFMPNANSELVVRGEVGKGNPDEWYGPERVIHTPPLGGEADYLVGAFWKDERGRPLTRSLEMRLRPGGRYEVDLRPSVPTRREVRK